MHTKVLGAWNAVLSARGDSIGLIDAESGREWSLRQLDTLATEFLQAHPELQGAAGQIWGLAMNDRVRWITVFVAAVKVGAVVLPLESMGATLLQEQAARYQVAFVITDTAVQGVVGPAVPPSDYFLLKLTSGTTGQPKCLPFTEAEMMADGAQIMSSMSISVVDRNFAILPLGHSYGLGNFVMPLLLAGVGLVLGSSPYPQVMLEELTRYQCTVLPIVPPLVKALSSAALEPGQLRDLRLVISAGALLSAKVATQFLEQNGLRVHGFYGSSETGGLCFDRSGVGAMTEGFVGTAMDGVELSVGREGQIKVKSAALCHALCAEDEAYALHDFGTLDAQGGLRLVGRHADIVKIAGYRISLSEIEQALCGLDGVSDAFVTTRETRTGELRCVALYSGEWSVEAVRAALLTVLPESKIPKQMRQVAAIPYNARGKKDREALAEMLEAFKRRR